MDFPREHSCRVTVRKGSVVLESPRRLENDEGMPHIAGMNRARKTASATVGFSFASPSLSEGRKGQKARVMDIVGHIKSAKARKSGTDITNISDEALLADLRRRQVRG